MPETQKSFIRIETDRATGKSEVEVAGTPHLLLFNLTAITAQVCDELNIPPELYAAHLPEYIRDYRDILKGKVAVGFNPFKKGGGAP